LLTDQANFSRNTIAGKAIVRAISGPNQALTHAMTTLAAGGLDITVLGTIRSDEIGNMAKAVKVFKESLEKNKILEQQQADVERVNSVSEIIKVFECNVTQIVAKFSQTSCTRIGRQ
jgi:methyl-accepting chemotaxis protein